MVVNNNTEKIPAMVKKTIKFFEDNNIWYILSKNLESRSCRDAANKRYRLGHIGISLQDELKSFFGKIINRLGKKQFVIIHCRGNQELDFDKIQLLLNAKSKVERLTDDEMAEYFGLEYGTVNPFTLDPHFLTLPVLQIFDESIFVSKYPPYTMMTNAGDLHWGIEFNPNELIKYIDNKLVADIVMDSSFIRQSKYHKIGILTGNSPESGIKLWNDINSLIRKKLSHRFEGDISFPKVVVNSIPELGLSMELDKREKQTWNFIREGIVSLCQQGCTIITVACNTSQYFKDKISNICEEYGARFFNMEDAVDNYLSDNKIKVFDFLAIQYTSDFTYWSGFKNIAKKYKVILPNETKINEFSRIAYTVKQGGVTGKGINKLRDLINNATSTDNVVIALTELSILLSSQKIKSKSGKVFIDTLELLAESIAGYYIKERYKDGEFNMLF